jgi:hypothetical protein
MASDARLLRKLSSHPMNPRAHRRLTAWLGMIALWLIVLAPVVSQLVVAARNREPVAALCSATAPSADTRHARDTGMAATAMGPMSMSMPMPDTQHAHDTGMIACGYCDLLTSHAALPTVAPSLLVLVMLVTIAAMPILSTRFTPFGAFPSGRPRAPPVVS